MSHVLNNLRELAQLSKNQTITFRPYMTGGGGHYYTEEEINIMEYIIQNGSSVDINGGCSSSGGIPLHTAYRHNNDRFIDFLIQNGADQHDKDFSGKIPSDYCSRTYNLTSNN
uniref:Ankyrin repeat protein n=1 Tax=Pithovirus LCPAC101 TaxID=2506586 RepID=A0A481Z4Q6_9VIRU|nr:MAG: ankyrin repeat protein [Pithovirus LCPAC101]